MREREKESQRDSDGEAGGGVHRGARVRAIKRERHTKRARDRYKHRDSEVLLTRVQSLGQLLLWHHAV